jgi:DNA-directed RNA polymerase specialized sigma24 family protein
MIPEQSGTLLADLKALPLEERSAFVLKHSAAEIRSAIAAIPDRELAAEMCTSQVAWAIALNFDYYDDPPEQPLSWSRLWEKLSGAAGGATRSRLTDYAIWILGIQRPDWLAPGHAIDPDVTVRAFKIIYDENHSRISQQVLRSAHSHAEAEEFIQQAWFEICCKYLSPAAPNRFLGLSTIARFVSSIAEYHVYKRRRHVPLEATAPVSVAPLFPEEIEKAETAAILRKCLEILTPRQRYVIEGILQGQEQVALAKEHKVSEAAISQLAKTARTRLGECVITALNPQKND